MNTNFFKQTGMMAIGSRLRMLTSKITDEAANIYELYGIELKPKWFPVFFVLMHGEAKTITTIADEIGHSHPSVSNIIKEMTSAGLIVRIAESDGRKNKVSLSAKGEKMSNKLNEQCKDVGDAVEQIINQTQNNLWKAIEEWENLLEKESLKQKVKDIRKKRINKFVEILPYEEKYHKDFKKLNEEWIAKHWQLEETDLLYLNNPQKYILDKGGYIFVAIFKDKIVGVCALTKRNGDPCDYELCKLAVSPKAQRMGIGELLCQTAITKAKILEAKMIYLETNKLLKPAIHLYEKLGFKRLKKQISEYKRGDIQMELKIEQ